MFDFFFYFLCPFFWELFALLFWFSDSVFFGAALDSLCAAAPSSSLLDADVSVDKLLLLLLLLLLVSFVWAVELLSNLLLLLF